jgi:putative ABC transport system permease protein
LPSRYRTPADLAHFHDELMTHLTPLAGVRDVGFISVAPLSGLLLTVPFSVAGDSGSSPAGRRPYANFRVIDPTFFAAAGTRLLRGRGFSDRDRAASPPIAVVSEALADRWLGAAPLGRLVSIDDNDTSPRSVEVVGIVENVRHATLSGPAGFDIYVPLSQIHPDGVTFVRNNQFWMMRSDIEAGTLGASFIKALQAVDPDAAVSGVGTMRQGLEAWFAPRQFSLDMFVAFSLTAVLLAVSGLYGLVAYAVSRRRREIGLRMALGASVAAVRWLILRDAARLTLAGIGIGMVLATVVHPLRPWLASETAADPVVISTAAALLFAIVMLAGALPARRASRIDPTTALRSE